MEIGRFAPSPSGRMHLGNVFAALLSWLSVKSENGELLLRIEDLDPERCRPEYADALRRDLEWLGLTWDREQICQSQREKDYRVQFEKLDQMGLVYPCYCTRGELHAASAPHASDGQPVYPGTCRNLSRDERAAKTRAPAWRLIVPDETVSFTDGLQGRYEENLAKDCGDFIIRRSDGVYAYQLAVVTDDAAGGVTQIVRGRDLLSSTPRQIWLQRQLGFPTPRYFHLPLLVAPDGRRLSKRDGDLELGALRRTMAPGDVVGLLAELCGLRPDRAPVSPDELAREFSWTRVRKGNIAILNP